MTAKTVLALFILLGASSEGPSETAAPTRIETVSAELLSRYTAPGDSLKRRAAEYLLAGLPAQWHYDVERLELMDQKKRVSDIEVIDADYLAENIDYAFRAWELPWAREVSFEDFCRYLLPYKMGNEAPERWRAAVWEEYAPLREAAVGDPGMTPSEICRRVAAEARKWYTFMYNYNYPVDAGYLKAKELGAGTCIGASLMILYPLRALGVCATYEFVPQWANRSGAHAWNALYEGGRLVPFSSIDLEPGRAKQEFVGVGRMVRKRSKVLRKEYRNGASVDVTREYMPTADLEVLGRGARTGTPQLMVFDNAGWHTVGNGTWRGRRALFAAAVRGVAYLPTVWADGHNRALCWPLVVERNGHLKQFRPRLWRQTVRLTAKYPEDDSNAIFPGQHYELFYWRNGWVSLGIQEATDTVLEYRGVPKGALLWLRNLDEGKQERIFAYENGKQIWY
jgi:hypothetical protein